MGLEMSFCKSILVFNINRKSKMKKLKELKIDENACAWKREEINQGVVAACSRAYH